MFEEFLKTRVQELIEASTDEYDIEKKDIETIIDEINNENLWDMIDNAIFEVIDKYRMEVE
jgi:hypothetical protein